MISVDRTMTLEMVVLQKRPHGRGFDGLKRGIGWRNAVFVRIVYLRKDGTISIGCEA